MPHSNNQKYKKPLLISFVLAFLAAIVHLTGIRHVFRLENATLLRDWVAEFGLWGPLIFILIYIIACLLFIPGLPITVLGAMAFGPLQGTFFSSIGATLGAAAAFLTARYAARAIIEERLESNQTFKRIDQGVEQHGWRMLMITRLVPLFPFNLQNFAYGLTKIPLSTYVTVSWICMLPGAAAYSFMAGSVVAGEGDPRRIFFYLSIGAVLFILISLIPGWVKRRQQLP